MNFDSIEGLSLEDINRLFEEKVFTSLCAYGYNSVYGKNCWSYYSGGDSWIGRTLGAFCYVYGQGGDRSSGFCQTGTFGHCFAD